jgi:antirestriction protein ArdC
MKTDQIKEVTDRALEQLVAAIEQGKSEALTRYLSAMGRFHRYSFHNVMLIYTQKREATHVAGFNSWRKLGRYVRKGEKGILILAPMTFKRAEPETAIKDDEEQTILRFKAAYVFDISQTEGEPLPEFAAVQGDPAGHTAQLKQFALDHAIEISYSASIAPALGQSSGGKIVLLPGLSPAEEFATLAHELAHELLHQGERRTGTTKTLRETEAEAVAFVVCQSVGLNNGSASSDYIQLYSGDKQTLSS